MILETKFSIGDKVYAIINNEIIKVTVKQIDIEITEKQKFIQYKLNWDGTKWETKMQSEIYRYKEDIIKDLK